MRAAKRAAASKPGSARSEASSGELARDLAALMLYVFKTSGTEYYSLVGELDLTITQIKTLHRLEMGEHDLSVKELSEGLGLSLPATSRNVEGLLQRGLLERFEDEHDRRVRRIRITELGREVAQRLDRARLAGLERFAESLGTSERRRLRAALAPVLRREELHACRPPSGPGSVA